MLVRSSCQLAILPVLCRMLLIGVMFIHNLLTGQCELSGTQKGVVSVKITGVQTYVVFAGWRNWVFVQLTTDEGITGCAEATLEGKEQAVVAAIGDLEHCLVGRDPLQIERHVARMYGDPFWRGGPVLMSAISGVEHCLWDITGKAYGQPV